jgi:3-oxoacyl-[acyl-carrier-protein] synthase II
MKKVFGENLKNIKFSAIKSSIGHSLAAASGVETVYLIKSLEEQLVPPTINVDDPDDFVQGLDYVPNPHTKHTFEYAMKNSFGFGGANASSIFKKWVA